MKKKIAFFGASGGVGGPLAEFLEKQGHELYSFGRSESKIGSWTKVDLTNMDDLRNVANKFKETDFDALIFAAGTWEEKAFTREYSFRETSLEDNLKVLNVNLTAPILLVRIFAKNLVKANGAKIIFFGALSGLDHYGSREVANTATKFGLVGAIQSLHKELKVHNISCTVINPENIETEEVLEDIASGRTREQITIPLDDIFRAVDFVLNTSNRSAITEINIEQTGN